MIGVHSPKTLDAGQIRVSDLEFNRCLKNAPQIAEGVEAGRVQRQAVDHLNFFLIDNAQDVRVQIVDVFKVLVKRSFGDARFADDGIDRCALQRIGAKLSDGSLFDFQALLFG